MVERFAERSRKRFILNEAVEHHDDLGVSRTISCVRAQQRVFARHCDAHTTARRLSPVVQLVEEGRVLYAVASVRALLVSKCTAPLCAHHTPYVRRPPLPRWTRRISLRTAWWSSA